MELTKLRVRLVLLEEALGTASGDTDVYRTYIASKAPDAATTEDEVEALGVDAVVEKGMTVFPKLDDGTPFLYDYQIKGFFKGAAGFLRKADGTLSKKLTAYKKAIDGLVFIDERKVPFAMPEGGEIGYCQRPLRAQTAQGERVALAMSETVPAGSILEFTITVLQKDLMPLVKEWLDFGKLSGLGQWRGGGKGRFDWTEVSVNE